MRPEILTNLLKAKLIILLLMCFSGLYGQDLYETKIMLKGTSNSTHIDIKDSHSIILEPTNGTATFFNIGFLCKFLVYTPNPDFIGTDSLILEIETVEDGDTIITFEAYKYLVKGIIANTDYYLLHKDSTHILEIVSNDLIGDDSTEIVNVIKLNDSNADIVIDSTKLYTYFNDEGNELYLRYIICNNLDECDDAYINIKYRETFTENSNDTIIRYLRNGDELFMVFDFEKFTYTKRPSKGYLITHKPNVIKYTPYSNQSDNDTITVQKIEGDFTKTQTYIIYLDSEEVQNDFLASDFYRTSINTPIEFDVFENDLFDSLLIDSFTLIDTGLLTYVEGGQFLFEPEDGFVGHTDFSYKVCVGDNCEWATVTIQVISHAPQLNNYNLTTSKNSPLIIRFNSDFEMFDYEFLSYPTNGTLDYYPGYHEDEINGKSFSGYNLMVYTPFTDFVGEDIFYLNYCTVPEDPCKNMTITIDVLDYQPIEFCLDDCIWPGDANNDGVVSGLDLLSLGYNMGETGETRENSEDLWIGQEGPNWNRTQGVLPIDLKFVDSDGNGEVAFEDLESLDEYYLNTHAFHIIQEVSLNSNDFTLILPEDSLFIGDTATIFIVIGSEDNMVQSMNGFTFNFDFDQNVFDEENVEVEFIDDNFFFDNAPIIDLVKQPYSGRLDVGASRLTKDPVGGFGMAVKASFIVIDDIDGFKIDRPDDIITNLTMNSVLSMDGAGGVSRSPDKEYKLVVHQRKRDYENPNEQKNAFVFISPNPSSGNLNVVTDNFNGQVVYEIVNTNGSIIETGTADSFNFQLNLKDLPSGLYLLNVTDGKSSVVKKFQKI